MKSLARSLTKVFRSLPVFFLSIFSAGALKAGDISLSNSSRTPASIHFTSTAKQVFGTWQFEAYRYRGQVAPRPNPNLIMTFEFEPSGLNTLRWERTDEEGFCERKAQFQIQGASIHQVIVWVNPLNAMECGQDSDMQMGKASRFEFRLAQDQLESDFPLGDETITYIWKRVD